MLYSVNVKIFLKKELLNLTINDTYGAALCVQV